MEWIGETQQISDVGPMTKRVTVSQVDPAAHPPAEFQGWRYPITSSLASWLEQLGGYTGDLPDPKDPSLTYPIDLSHWRGCDPATTWLVVTVTDD
jgi:hypothetical protein